MWGAEEARRAEEAKRAGEARKANTARRAVVLAVRCVWGCVRYGAFAERC